MISPARTVMISVLSIHFCTNDSKSKFCSNSIHFSNDGLVAGCSGTKTVQQSSYGRIEISYVSIFLAISIISFLSSVATDE